MFEQRCPSDLDIDRMQRPGILLGTRGPDARAGAPDLLSSTKSRSDRDLCRIGCFKIPRSLLVCLSLVVLFALSQSWFRDIALMYTDKTKQVVAFKRDWVRKAGFLKDSGGKDSIFFIGTSKITAGIVPEEFDVQLNGRVYSYNLALPALPLAPHYFMLEDYLKRNKPPKYIILLLETDGFRQYLFSAYSIMGAGLNEALRYSYLAKNAEIIWSHIYPLGSFWPNIKKSCLIQALSFLPAAFREAHKKAFLREANLGETYKHDWEYIYQSEYAAPEKAARDLRRNLLKNRGYYYIIEQAVKGGNLSEDYVPPWAVQQSQPPVTAKGQPPTPQQEITPLTVKDQAQANIQAQPSLPQQVTSPVKAPKITDPFVEKFFALNERNGTMVILIDDYSLDYKGRVDMPRGPHPQLWHYLKQKYKNVYFMTKESDVKFYRPGLFSDPAHLNREGARIYTREIAAGFEELLKTLPQGCD